MNLRRPLALFAAVVVTAALAYEAYWFTVAGMIRDGIEEWAVARRADGLVVAYEDLAMSGFPARFIARLSRPQIDGWSADNLVAEVAPHNLNRITITLPESQRLTLEGAPLEMTLTRGTALVVMADGVVESLEIEADGMALVTPQGLFSLARLTGFIRKQADDRLALEIDGSALVLASQAETVMGREIDSLGLSALHDGALPTAWSGPALAAWSGDGGTLEVARLLVNWGDVEIAADGTLTLDGELRPEGAFSAEIAGYGGLLDRLAETGTMRQRDASFAKTFLNLMAKKIAGRRVIKAPITAQGGKLFIGPLPLLKLKPLF